MEIKENKEKRKWKTPIMFLMVRKFTQQVHLQIGKR